MHPPRCQNCSSDNERENDTIKSDRRTIESDSHTIESPSYTIESDRSVIESDRHIIGSDRRVIQPYSDMQADDCGVDRLYSDM